MSNAINVSLFRKKSFIHREPFTVTEGYIQEINIFKTGSLFGLEFVMVIIFIQFAK